MMKSLLLHFPWFYERIQAARDLAHYHNASARGSYSQHGEDMFILECLEEAGAHGRFIDVGCNHPFRLSNTYLLYTKGWRGVCVDPLLRYASLFRRWRPEDLFVLAAVGPANGSMTLFEFESDVLSTLDSRLAEQYIKQGFRLRRELSVPVMPLDGILESAKLEENISLLSLDIEGHELNALQSMNLAKWRPQFCCLELKSADGSTNQPALDYLLEHGYREISDNGLNVILHRD